MKAIILAAGLGSRLGDLTKHKPKSLIKIGSKTLLERLTKQLEDLGVNKIQIICGHEKKKIDKYFSKYQRFYYPRYKTTNNLHTLYYFRRLLNDDCIISFADVIFHKEIINGIIKSKKKITLGVDTKNCRENTMKVDIKRDQIKYVGNNPKIKSGNFIGILKVNKSSNKILKNSMKKLVNKSNNFYFTEALNIIIGKNIRVNYFDVNKKFWIEIDNKDDLKNAKKKIYEIEK